MADESCQCIDDLKAIAPLGVYRAVSLKLAKFGGYRCVDGVLPLLSASNLLGYAGGTSESVLGVTAAVHYFSSRSGLIPGCDFYFPYRILAPQPLQGGVRPQNGFLLPADQPGLGCTPPAEWFESA